MGCRWLQTERETNANKRTASNTEPVSEITVTVKPGSRQEYTG